MPKKVSSLFVFACLFFVTLSGLGETILIHAHRGGRAARPENTLPAFEYAIKNGADVLELDLAVTKDNVLVVSHFPYLTPPVTDDAFMKSVLANERQCVGPVVAPGTLIHSLTLAQLKQYDCGSRTLKAFPQQVAVPHTTIPTFDEVLDLAPQGTFDFNVETKISPLHPEYTPTPEEFVRMIDAAVRKHKLQSRVILQSFDFRTLVAMKKIDPEIRLSALFGMAKYDSLMGIKDSNKDFPHIAEVSGAGILSPDDSLVTPESVAAAHKAGLQVAPYTINTAEGWKRMADAHVDAIITDDPAGLLQWLRAQTPALHP
ncbi:glycerophosphoryl diester phosphodiesterase [Terriglobus roseus DSM 18391]|uniref:Glycerophosphoryl diester phosphodiesterase n=1 Tax=Terriglobus roseus (strain DSM 18391 / NRRL B-41598 / KBS 63) TaxID=926566 RepID=I3ZL26_TERRK|nr:glycerophosphodiester phosphodiesterase family protein [Terriglobus roseus]AFL89944.1 glycerophosphoryl diester phosphodiesterase [Terriglobus roseus DSM 18391]